MIAELLSVGAENAITGKDLAAMAGCNIRDITGAVERERRQGEPICAETNGINAGYYLAADAEELEQYCNRLKHRAIELFKTRQALLNALKQIAEKKADEA